MATGQVQLPGRLQKTPVRGEWPERSGLIDIQEKCLYIEDIDIYIINIVDRYMNES